jgi:NADPH2:quinone reductase
MKAIVVRQYGAPEVMKLEDVPVPQPGAGEVLVRIHAAGVNPVEAYMRSGNYSLKPPVPFTPGGDGAGVIESVGASVTRVKPGDRVYTARTLSGTYAEYALALESQVYSLPERVSFAQGAGVHVPYATAYRALHQVVRARAAETVLVHGASGGVGIAAVQIARAIGMVVLATAGTPRGLDLVRREGAHHAFDHHAPAYRDEIAAAAGGRGVDVVVEMLANANLGADMKILALHGRIVVVGSRGDATLTPRDLMSHDGSVHAFTLWNISPSDAAEVHAGVIAGLANGTLRPVVGKELPLAEAPQAHKDVLEPGAFGKIVLIP